MIAPTPDSLEIERAPDGAVIIRRPALPSKSVPAPMVGALDCAAQTRSLTMRTALIAAALALAAASPGLTACTEADLASMEAEAEAHATSPQTEADAHAAREARRRAAAASPPVSIEATTSPPTVSNLPALEPRPAPARRFTVDRRHALDRDRAHRVFCAVPEPVDGDTIDCGVERIRLAGIDAPDWAQTCRFADGRAWPCGEAAAGALGSLIGAAPFDCLGIDTDRFGRDVVVCAQGDNDIGELMVRAGLAVDDPRHAPDYSAAEAAAKAARQGVHAGDFVLPWDWRAGVRLP